MKNTLLSRMEVLLDYLGLFISTFALAYFIYPNVTWAIVSGWISTFLYVCIIQFQSLQPDSTVSKKIVQFIISMFACAFIGVLCYWMKSYLTLYLDELNIYDWIIVIAFIIATTGTIIPMANKKKRPLKIMLYIILAGILILTFIKSPENISFNKKKSLNTEEILVLNKALENYKPNNIDSYDTIKIKLNKINTRSDLDRFILFASLILAGLTLLDWADTIRARRKMLLEDKK